MTSLSELVAERHVIVCCGTGGVGKTTTAAAVAVEAARRGRAAVVVTIDPARRLADALGVETLGDAAHEVDRALWDPVGDATPGGRLDALMLDTKSTFDRLIVANALNDEHAQRILDNRFYRNLSDALSGTQEYMAMEKLYELHDTGTYDLIVVDTPPSRHALDFLDAPGRLTRLLDHRVFRMIMMPARTTLRVTSIAAQAFLRTIARVVGNEVVDDVVAFFRAFEGMEEGFRARADHVRALLAGSSTAFVLVTSPRRDAVDEAAHFATRLAGNELRVEALVVNRVHPRFSDEDPSTLRARALAHADERGLAAGYANLADLVEIAAREERQLERLRDCLPGASPVFVPELEDDVHAIAALRTVAGHLLAPQPPDSVTRAGG